MGLLVFVSFITLLMGVIVWARKPAHSINQLFLGLCVSLALWTTTNALFTVTNDGLQYVDALMSYAAAGLVATFFFGFALALKGNMERVKLVLVLGVVFAGIAGIPGLIATGVHEQAIETTAWAALYALWIVSYFGCSIYVLISARGVTRQRRTQMRAVLIGAILAMLGGAVCNLLLPLAGNYEYVLYGPLFSMVFVGLATYAIVRHRLFDIRRTIGRLVAYGLSVITLGAGFGYVVSILLGSARITLSTTSTIVVVSTGIAILFAPTKKFFDTLMQRVFLRSQYDIQQSIDTMTRVFSQTQTVSEFKQKTASSLAKIIKANDVHVREAVPAAIREYINKHGTSIIIRDDVEEMSHNSQLLNQLFTSKVALLVPLVSQQAIIGYLVLGDKANGTAYTPHDYKFIDLISDEMVIAYENVTRLESIQEFNQDLQARVEQATKELRYSNKKLQELDESKDEFISMASHQLRTPLTTVKGYISMLLDGDIGEITPQQRKVLEEAFNSSQRMVYLIGDFLNVSRLQTGKFELESHEVELGEVIEQEVDQMRDGARSRKMKLDYQRPARELRVSLDENKIRQVVMNFLDNAIYYSKTGDVIQVVLSHNATHISLKVTDHGMGVPVGERHRLFSKFYRASNAKKQRPDGTGIGLFMARKVVVAHGGTMIFETTEGKGSTFGFRLPLSK